MSKLEKLIGLGWVPTPVLKVIIHLLIRKRKATERKGGIEAQQQRITSLIEELKKSPIAVLTEKANEQHYEVPAQFYQAVLGNHLKYSSCYWQSETQSLSQAEEEMLKICCKRAELQDGMDILELGCGWGSLSLWMAQQYPKSRITAVSNSNSQKLFIDRCAAQRNLSNLQIVTCDMNEFASDNKFDRIVSIEMFEHMRNYHCLLERISSWLKLGGKLFVHIFCNRDIAYLFESKGAANWMGRHFFSGGIMPSDHLLTYFQEHLKIEQHWRVSGVHYEKTAKAWRENMDMKRLEVLDIFSNTYGKDNAAVWFARWKLFFLACEQLFGFAGGEEWFVSHYLFNAKH